MTASVACCNASAQSSFGSRARAPSIPVVVLTAESEGMAQCVTNRLLAPAPKKPRASPDNPSARGRPSGVAVLQADKITKSASSFRLLISDRPRKPSFETLATSGGVNTSPGSLVPRTSPARAPCVAKATTRYCESGSALTVSSLASEPTITSSGLPLRTFARVRNSSSVSGKLASSRSIRTSASPFFELENVASMSMLRRPPEADANCGFPMPTKGF